MRRRCAAAAAHDCKAAVLRHFVHQLRKFFRINIKNCFAVYFFRQPGIWVQHSRQRRCRKQLRQKFLHLRRAEPAVKADSVSTKALQHNSRRCNIAAG